jgi:penicillin V acylase-like amidase (Ntn superfamily)
MTRKIEALLAIVAALAAIPSSASACTTFCLERSGDVVFGKNYDFGIGSGMLVVNKRGVSKVSQVGAPDHPARWVSQYGSLTFNQFGREFPSGGMNEAGLVVELMWLRTRANPKVRTVALASFDLSCRTPVQVSDVDANPNFTDYSPGANRASIEKAYRGVDFLRDTPASELDRAAAYPDRTSCVR